VSGESARAWAVGRARIWLLPVLWALCLLQILTSAPNRPFTLLEPWTAGFWAILAAYLVTSAALAWPRRLLVVAHLAVVVALFALHPLSAVFGRDGALVAIGAYALALLWTRAPLRAEPRLLAASVVAGVLVVEAGLSLADAHEARPRRGLLDYGDLLGSCGRGGCLRPGLDAAIVTERGEGRFVTNEYGFRNRTPVHRRKPDGLRRVLLIGDSFVAGYRTDQEDTLGRRLEVALREAEPGSQLQVLIAELPHPAAALDYLQTQAWRLAPDLLVVGVTIGNDLAQSWGVRRRVPEPLVADLLLPADAFRRSALVRLALRLDRSLLAWRGYRRAASLLRTSPITCDYADFPGHVHVFDAMHGLGFFYARRRLPLIEDSWREAERLLIELRQAARDAGAPLVVTLFPQRFQTSGADWRATGFEYGLDAAAFDLDLPNRRLAEACAQAEVECVDLLPPLRAESRPTYLPRGDMHWNALGQAIAARALAPRLAARLRPSS
jgi:hypothetical protein